VIKTSHFEEFDHQPKKMSAILPTQKAATWRTKPVNQPPPNKQGRRQALRNFSSKLRMVAGQKIPGLPWATTVTTTLGTAGKPPRVTTL